ncbi:MAG TPA: maltotransferase domain-containing protein, partial [Gemmatimonadaceae bacterium]|nr:maltotransferase domain-containing protein [Gemmatimonadaceae bacterium]
MHGVRLVRTPPTNTSGSATMGRDESIAVMSGASMATQYILHHDERKFPRLRNPCLARAPTRGEGFLGRVVRCGHPPASFFTHCQSMAAPRSSSQSPRPTRPSPQARSRRTSIGTQQPPRKPPHIAIECVSPSLDDGRWAVKRILGDSLEVTADIFKDGHDVVAARLRFKPPGITDWRTAPMVFDYNSDRWTGGIALDAIGAWAFTVDAWTDHFGTWRAQLEKKIDAGHDVSLDLLEGAQFVDTATHRARFGDTRRELAQWAARLREASASWRARARDGLDLELLALMVQHLAPDDLTSYDRELRVWVDRERARCAAWYEMFPRSQSGDASRHGTFADAERALARVAELGFDVVYLPPIHPVGVTNRKGRNNTLAAAPDDPGSPWAIGG